MNNKILLLLNGKAGEGQTPSSTIFKNLLGEENGASLSSHIIYKLLLDGGIKYGRSTKNN